MGSLGTAKGASVLDLQVNGRYTQGAVDPTTESAAQEALQYLLDNKADGGAPRARIALLGFAGNISETGASTLAAQAKALWEQGVLLVVPAGGSSALHVSPYVLTVADQAATCGSSSPGSATIKPDMAAPARDVQAAVPGNPAAPGGAASASGTHLAAAAVAGTAAVMWQERPDLPVDAVAAILRDTASRATSPDTCTGFGALDGAAAVAAAKAWTDPVPPGTTGPATTPGPLLPVLAVALVALVAVLRRRQS